MTSPIETNNYQLIDTVSRQLWQQAAFLHFQGEELYYQDLGAKIVLFLQNRQILKLGQTLGVACGDLKRLGFCLALHECLSNQGYAVKFYASSQVAKKLKGRPDLDLNFDLPSSLDVFIDCFAPIQAKAISPEIINFIQAAQSLKAYKLAIECPSGLHPDTGFVGKSALQVDLTLSLEACLQGLWTGYGREYAGQIETIRLYAYPGLLSAIGLMHSHQIKTICPKRQSFSHKHMFRTVSVLAGEASMFGAAVLAARAALVMGAGLVKVFYSKHLNPPYGQYPEIMWHPITQNVSFIQAIKEEDILIIGPGWGNGAWAHFVWEEIKTLKNEMVVDASALRFLAENAKPQPNWIMTPHPGEAALLLKTKSSLIQKNRLQAINTLHEQYSGTWVLKGSGTLVLGDTRETWVCPLGNAGMASPGMGDILSGLIAAALAQGLTPLHAAVYAVWMHAESGDKVAKQSINGIVLASQILNQIQEGGIDDEFNVL
jgi:NAD(P)H-hydrate epimerase